MESLCSVAMSARVNSTPAASSACNTLCSVSSQSSAYRSALLSGRPLQMRIPYNLLAAPSRSMKCIRASAVSSPEKFTDVEEKTQLKENNTFSPNSYEVQSLLMEVCDETNIAELELKIGEFKMHVKRDVTKLKGSAPQAVLVAPPIPSQPMEQSDAPIVIPPTPKAPAGSSTSIVPNSASKSGSKIGLLEAAADEGLHFVTSPKVGVFRRSRVVKKKTGRPLCEEGQIVKEGQVVCYVEQLGTQQPVEADKSGEVMKIVCKDGESVGYGDPLIAIRPSFAGIK